MPKTYRLKTTDENTPIRIMRKIAKIDKYNYNDNLRVLSESYLEYFKAFNGGFILAYNLERIVGYLHWVPVTKEFYERVKKAKNKLECIPKIEDIVTISEDGNFIFVKSFGVYEKFRYNGVGTDLFDAFVTIMLNDKFSNCVNNVISASYSGDGHRLLSRYGFKVTNSVSDKFKIFEKEI